MSIGFIPPHPDEAVIWRGPRKNGLIKQFLKDVHWAEIDYLVVDAPHGTSDDYIQFLQASGIKGAVIVMSFCKKVEIQVLGVVENMTGLRQPALDLKFERMVTGEKGTAVEDVTEASFGTVFLFILKTMHQNYCPFLLAVWFLIVVEMVQQRPALI